MPAVAPTDIHDVSLPPDTQKPPAKPKLSLGERRRRTDDRLQTIRLRMLIGQAMHSRGITTPAAIGAAIGMPAAEATKLLNGKQWRAGDVALLEAVVMRLGLQVPELSPR